MDFRALQCFIGVAQTRNFTRAAEQLYITQPALSRKIAELEREYGCPLFRRKERPVELTAAGTIFYKRAKQIMADCLLLEEEMAGVRQGMQLPLSIGYGMAGHMPFLTRALETLRAQSPDIHVSLLRMFNATVIEALAEGRCDAGLVNLPEGIAESWALHKRIFPCGLCAFIPLHHPLAQRASIRLGDLAQERLITFSRSTSPRQYDYILETCRQAGFEPNVVAHAPDTSTFAMLLQLEGLIALMPATTTVMVADLVKVVLVSDTQGFDMALVWHKANKNPGIQLLCEALCQD